MSGELSIENITDLSAYGIIQNSSRRRWNGTQFEVFTSGNYSLYAVTVTEDGTTGAYGGDFPIGITTQGEYHVVYYDTNQAPGVPTEGDRIIGTQDIVWSGSEVVTTPAVIPGAMDGSDFYDYIIRALKRTDKETEVFDAVKDTIDEIRLRLIFPEDETDGDTTDTITVLGDYRLALEGDFGHLISAVVLIDGNFGYTLEQITKGEYDRRYTGLGTSASARGRPRAFCLFDGNILVGPVPDKTTYVYKLAYSADDLASYDSDSVSIPFTDKYRELLRWGVLAKVFSDILKNDDQAAKFGTLFESKLKMIERRLDRNRTGVIHTAYSDF